jgi:hypothetical protein
MSSTQHTKNKKYDSKHTKQNEKEDESNFDF